MVSNKKKASSKKKTSESSSRSDSNKDIKETERKQPEASAPSPPNFLSKSQLASLIMLSLGVSRLLQLGGVVSSLDRIIEAGKDGSAIEDGEGESSSTDSDAGQPSASCIEYMGDGACRDDGLRALLRYNYYAGAQCAMLILAMTVQCWKVEKWLSQLNAWLILSPVLTSILSVYGSVPDVVSSERARKHAFVCLIICLVALPDSTTMNPADAAAPGNARGGFFRRKKTLQSLCLITLFVMNAWQAVQLALPIVHPFLLGMMASEDHYDITSVTRDLLTVPSELAPSILLVKFLAIDKLTSAIVYILAWFHLQEQQQRSLLLYVGIIKMISSMYQLPRLQKGNPDEQTSALREEISSAYVPAELTIGIFCLLCWIAPPIAWKKKIN